MNRRIEFIESYIKIGNDYQWSDNHGELVRCKDCKHRPTKPDDYNPITTDGFALEFPDEKCPCQCEDGWYSKYPDDDWYCADGDRKDDA